MNKPMSKEAFCRDPMRSVARAAIAHGRYAIDRAVRPERYITETWPFDDDALLLVRAATSPADMTSAVALVQIAVAVFEALVPFSAAFTLFDRAMKVTLSRNAGSFTVPSLDAVAVKFVAEGAMIPVLQGLSTGARVDPHKIAGIIAVSSELFGMEAIEQIMQRLLAESAGPAADAIVFSALAASTSHPAGLLNGIAATPASAATDKFEAMTEDLANLAGAVGAKAGATKITYVMNPVQAMSANLRTYGAFTDQLLASNGVPAGTVVAVADAAVVAAVSAPTFETAKHAAIQMSDTPSASVMAGGDVTSLWQTDSVGISMVLGCSWALRSAGAVAMVSSVNW